MLSKLIIVKGLVQGVFFRASCADYAKKLGIFGYAKNLEEGSVEIVAQGDEEKLNFLITWCFKGPKYAKVSEVTFKNIDIEEIYDGFYIK